MRVSDEHLDIIQKQFELDCNLFEAEKINDHFYISPTKVLEGSRVINKMDPFFRVIVFYGKVYVMADEDTIPGWIDVLKDCSADWFFTYSNLRKIDYILNEFDREIVDTHIYYLPDADAKKAEKNNNYIWLDENSISGLRDSIPFHNALCYSPTQPDYICVGEPVSAGASVIGSDGKYIDGSLKGLAGASIDGKYVRQIGIDIDKKYRGQGLAVNLVTTLKEKIIDDLLLPFYGTNESHSISRLVGVKSGFIPAFSEIFVAKKGENFASIYNQ